MKPEELYQHLKDLAEKLEIIVTEKNFRNAGIHVKSGMCNVEGKDLFIIDKHKSVRDKVEILSEGLSKISTEDLYVIPAVREILDKHAENKVKVLFKALLPLLPSQNLSLLISNAFKLLDFFQKQWKLFVAGFLVKVACSLYDYWLDSKLVCQL